MNRYKDYICFVIWFAGLGTIVLWLLTSPHAGGRLFGDSLFCRADAFAPLGWLCLSAGACRWRCRPLARCAP